MAHWQFLAGYGAAATTAIIATIFVIVKRLRDNDWTSSYGELAPGAGILTIAVIPIFLGVLVGWLAVHSDYDSPQWVYRAPATAPGWSHHASKVTGFAQKEIDEAGGHGHTYAYMTELVITTAGDEVAVNTHPRLGSVIRYGCPKKGVDFTNMAVDNQFDQDGATLTWTGCFGPTYVYSYLVPPAHHTPLAWWMMPAGFGLWLVPLGSYILAWRRRW